ncbi:39755_t:CDS:2 [Gigaspora margarita]|uniref:39755_t:CDS:1 n=1 Tax=Gigaspora margarita TaxID=4874 RepID=A0ABN7VJQ2_GIGMA|nr:39755_t:CDS:2 [Gigaspora margarita]
MVVELILGAAANKCQGNRVDLGAAALNVKYELENESLDEEMMNEKLDEMADEMSEYLDEMADEVSEMGEDLDKLNETWDNMVNEKSNERLDKRSDKKLEVEAIGRSLLENDHDHRSERHKSSILTATTMGTNSQ